MGYRGRAPIASSTLAPQGGLGELQRSVRKRVRSKTPPLYIQASDSSDSAPPHWGCFFASKRTTRPFYLIKGRPETQTVKISLKILFLPFFYIYLPHERIYTYNTL